jgi:hypothetical protein
MVWICMGGNPVGQDLRLGSVRRYTLEDAVKQCARKLWCCGIGTEVAR